MLNSHKQLLDIEGNILNNVDYLIEKGDFCDLEKLKSSIKKSRSKQSEEIDKVQQKLIENLHNLSVNDREAPFLTLDENQKRELPNLTEDGFYREYYENGNIQSSFERIDNNVEIAKFYDKEGNLQYETNKLQNDYSLHKSYYSNGQLASEMLYSKYAPYEVISFFDKDGNPLDADTLEKGTGVIHQYDAFGKLVVSKKYENGQFIKQSKRKKLK